MNDPASRRDEPLPGASASSEVRPWTGEARVYAADDVIAGKYRLDKKLGTGGMGAVWHARNLHLEADVAIKLIRNDLARLAVAVERLLQEARASARLQHPCIVRVFDLGQTEHGDPFIVMEVLDGTSLADLIVKRGRLSAGSAVRLMLPVINALAAAHDKGIVHRDLKPDNVILLQVEGSITPKIVDFGIAKLRDEAQHRKITLDGAVLGSPDYMSPEQARGRADVDERTDVWSTCVTLYEAMTGRLPFVAPNYHALVDAIVSNAPVPLTDLAAGDSWLWTIVERGLEKDPTMRWGSMRQLGRELAAWAVERGVTTDSMGVAIAPIWLDEESDQPLLAPRMSITNPGGRPARRTPISADIRLSTRPGPLAPEAPEEPHHAPLPSLTEPVALSSTQAPPPIKRRMGAVLGFIAGAIVAAGAFAFFATRPSTDGRAPAAGPPTLAMASASPPVVEALVADLGREQIVAPPAPSASASTAAAASASAAGSKRPRARPSVPAAKAAPTAAAQIDPPPKPTPLIPTDPNF